MLFLALLLLCSLNGDCSLNGGCSSATDCSLNGDCVDGACACDAAWSGSPICDVMSFGKLDKEAMPGYYNETESSWGGFPMPTDDGGFALVHAQMEGGCGLGTWTSNSFVGLSRSTTKRVEGPYAFEEPILPTFAHNPTVRRAADGTYVVYFIGSWPTTPQACGASETSAPVPRARAATPADAANTAEDACDYLHWTKDCGPDMPGPMNDTCGPADGADWAGNSGCGIAIASSASLRGPWTVRPLVIEDQWASDDVYCAHTNPSPVFLPNGAPRGGGGWGGIRARARKSETAIFASTALPRARAQARSCSPSTRASATTRSKRWALRRRRAGRGRTRCTRATPCCATPTTARRTAVRTRFCGHQRAAGTC